jgi:hypothetical protein
MGLFYKVPCFYPQNKSLVLVFYSWVAENPLFHTFLFYGTFRSSNNSSKKLMKVFHRNEDHGYQKSMGEATREWGVGAMYSLHYLGACAKK